MVWCHCEEYLSKRSNFSPLALDLCFYLQYQNFYYDYFDLRRNYCTVLTDYPDKGCEGSITLRLQGNRKGHPSFGEDGLFLASISVENSPLACRLRGNIQGGEDEEQFRVEGFQDRNRLVWAR